MKLAQEKANHEGVVSIRVNIILSQSQSKKIITKRRCILIINKFIIIEMKIIYLDIYEYIMTIKNLVE